MRGRDHHARGDAATSPRRGRRAGLAQGGCQELTWSRSRSGLLMARTLRSDVVSTHSILPSATRSASALAYVRHGGSTPMSEVRSCRRPGRAGQRVILIIFKGGYAGVTNAVTVNCQGIPVQGAYRYAPWSDTDLEGCCPQRAEIGLHGAREVMRSGLALKVPSLLTLWPVMTRYWGARVLCGRRDPPVSTTAGFTRSCLSVATALKLRLP
jgi:hypothetical protein